MTEDVNNYEVYLVGGAVRDELLGLRADEKDWVVVGSSEQKMREMGFKQVGKDFPVFLHPDSGDEYALARTERKVAPGHQGFEIQANPQTTLEEDLLRRDLTINAIAKTHNGEYIDPFDGQLDLKRRQLKHVSDAFAEDPLRVLRVARFKAQLSKFNFSVAAQTLELMKQLVQNGELSSLSEQRIWQETKKALLTTQPSVYFQTLRQCGALQLVFPQVDALFGVPQRADYHPEIDSGLHTMMVLDRAAQLSDDLGVRFAALTHDLGKALTPVSQLPRHIGHEKRGLSPLKALTDRYPVPNKIKTIARLCCEYHLLMHKFYELRPETMLKLLKNLDSFRQPQHVEHFTIVCQADCQGRKGLENKAYPQAQSLNKIFHQVNEISATDVSDNQITGPAIGRAINELRLNKIRQFKAQYNQSGNPS